MNILSRRGGGGGTPSTPSSPARSYDGEKDDLESRNIPVIPIDFEGSTHHENGSLPLKRGSSTLQRTSSGGSRAEMEPLVKSSGDNAVAVVNGGADSTSSDATPSKNKDSASATSSTSSSVVSRTGLMVLLLLAIQNCSKNLLMRYVMKDQPKFLTSAAVLGSEFTKLTLSTCYILFVQKKPLASIFKYLKDDRRNTILLAVPASAYNLQMSLEYVALANLNAAMFSVLVQTKLLFTATFAAAVLRKKLKYIQVISLVLLTSGVMLCNLSKTSDSGTTAGSYFDPTIVKGITATLGIALSSGFASVYTEKVIKAAKAKSAVSLNPDEYGLAYTQVQLALMSLLAIGVWAVMMDFSQIMEFGLFHNFTGGAFASVLMSAFGGLIVASVLKYADSVLKGYATACSVILTGVLSMVLFGTTLNVIYFMGIINVVTAVLLYNGKDMDVYVCS